MHSSCINLILLLATLGYAISQESSAESCYNDSSCGGDALNEDVVSPLECCSRLGYSYTSTISTMCHACLLAGFQETSKIIGVGQAILLIQSRSKVDLEVLQEVILSLKIIESDINKPITDLIHEVPNTVAFESGTTAKVTLETKSIDNKIALESNYEYTLELDIMEAPPGISIFLLPSQLHLSILDPDMASVSFSHSKYTVSEGTETVLVHLVRTGATASDFTITISCGKLFQIHNITAPASMSAQTLIDFRFMIPRSVTFSENSLELLEISQVSDDRIVIASPSSAEVLMIKNDTVFCGFIQNMYTFHEFDGLVSVRVMCSGSITNQVQLRVSGGPTDQPNQVIVSGANLFEVVTFFPNGPSVQIISFMITDDNVTLELTEAYVLQLFIVDSSGSGLIIENIDLNLYASTVITIKDDDSTVLSMEADSISISENVGLVTICAHLSKKAATNILVTFESSPLTAADPDDYLGSINQQTIAAGQLRTCTTYNIQIDEEVEQNEQFIVTITSFRPQEHDGISLGQQTSTTVTILDGGEREIEPVCIEEIDIVFVLDASGSVGLENFHTMIRFVVSLSENFQLGDQATQVGVVVFANEAEVEIRLGEFTDREQFAEAIMNVQYRATTTNTGHALELATKELQSSSRFGPELPGIIILFTDGQSTNPNTTTAAATTAKAMGMQILVIGIGPSINLDELRDIASDPAEHVFLIDDFSPLSFASILSPLVRTTCEIHIGFIENQYNVNEGDGFVDVAIGVLDGNLNAQVMVDFTTFSGTAEEGKDFTGWNQQVLLSPQNQRFIVRFNIADDSQPEEQEFFTASISTSNEFVKVTVPSTRVFISDNDAQTCRRQIDMVILLDASSIDEFEIMKEFVNLFTSEFQVGMDNAQFAVITFGIEATISFSLGEHMTAVACHHAVNNIDFQGGDSSNIADAIDLATQQFLMFGRNSAQHMIVVISGGMFSMPDRAIAVAAAARGHGIDIITIGKEFSLDTDHLKAISSDPFQDVFLLNEFSSDSFDGVLKPLVQHICFPICKRKLDTIMALKPSDRSSFEMMKQYMARVTEQFDVAGNAARFGVLYSSDPPSSVFITLGSSNNVNDLNSAIQSIQYVPVTGNVSATFNIAVEHFQEHGRKGIPKIYLQLLSLPADIEATKEISTAALDSDIQIFTIKFGMDDEQTKVGNILFVNNHTINSSLGRLSNHICNVPGCQSPPVDIIFGIDASNAIDSTEYTTVLNFVVDVVHRYRVSEESTHVGVIRFSSISEVVISLTQFLQLNELSKRIFDVHHVGGTSVLASAIVTAQQEFISSGRPEAKHILILTTGGQINDLEESNRAAEIAKHLNIEIFVLGVGKTIKEELNMIASDPTAEHSLMIEKPSVDALSSIVPDLTQSICAHKESPSCSQESEVTFIIDASANFGVENFNNIKQLVIGMVLQLDVSPLLTRVAVVVYSSRANLVIQLTQTQNQDEIITKIRELDFSLYKADEKVTGSAINAAQMEIDSEARVGVTRFMFLISSGGSSNQQHTLDAAEAAHNSGTVIVSLGIGDIASQTELQDVASSNKFFTVPHHNLHALLGLTDEFVKIICTEDPTCSLDLIFVVDSSGSTSASEYSRIVNFVARVVNQFDVSTTATHVGFISYGSIATSDGPYGLGVGSVNDKMVLVNLINSLQQLGGTERRTDMGIAMAYRQLMNYRPDIPNAVVVITTGISDDPVSTLNNAQMLLSLEDTEVFTVAITSDTRVQFIEEIYEISTDPNIHHVFLRNNARQESLDSLFQQIIVEFCNDDSNLHADPMFIVPLYGIKQGMNQQLCYEVYGQPNQYFNLLSDRCVSVNAHYTEHSSRKSRMLHIVDQIAIISSNNIGQCVEIVVELDTKEKLSVHVNGAKVNQEVKNGEVQVLSYNTHASVSVPNCASGEVLTMSVQLKTMLRDVSYLEFQIHGGHTIDASAHGLIGQFWNTPAKLSFENIELRDTRFSKNIRVLKIVHPDSPVRHVPVWLENSSWDERKTHTPCIYGGDSQGGHLYEVKSPSDSLIEGTYTDYIVDNLFSTNYLFSKFNETYCTN